jgi:pheromone a factor receptor
MRELPFIVGCASAIVCLLLPAAWHVRSKNSGTLLYLAWSLIGNLIYFVNSIAWAGNIGNPAPIWCDICAFSNSNSETWYQTDLKKPPKRL